MQTIQTQVNIDSDRQLKIQLPEEIETGQYQIVIVMNPQATNNNSPTEHNLNQLAGKIAAFKNIDAVVWQQEVREEWNETRLSP